MQGFTEDQIKQQDFVDNQIYDLVNRLIPSAKEIEWDIEMIGDIRDTLQHWLVDKLNGQDIFTILKRKERPKWQLYIN